MLLKKLIKHHSLDKKKIIISGIESDSRRIKKNYVFFSLDNKKNKQHIKEAIKKGASVIITGSKNNFSSKVPILKVKNISSFIRKLKDKGIQIVGTSDRGSDSLYDVDLNQGTAIVLGSEGWGLRKITGELCDCLISIPMAGKVDCLNVSVSAGVCLYETVRQRL